MPNYLTPGVYVEEVSSGARPIQPVGTSTAGFVGIAPDPSIRPHEPVAINSWSHFMRVFAPDPAKTESTHLAQGVHGFFLNGGSRCYVVNCQDENQLTGNRKGLGALETIDEIAIVAAPGFTSAAAYDAVLNHCEKMEDRVAILDGPQSVDSINNLTKVATAKATKKKDEDGESSSGDGGGLRPRNSDRGYGAVYFPWIVGRDPNNRSSLVPMPPSGHMAGIYARTDAQRGVHKAPANETVRGALNVSYRVTRQEQAELNPQGVNCIRFFPREGIRVWGARTLAPAASEWRYINVRRLFNMIKESIAESTHWVVFQPNDKDLWMGIKRDVSAFLTQIWRQGALFGSTPEEAFFVQCDAELNPPEVRDAGKVITRIGLAPVKPAEFVIFQIGQDTGGAQTEEQA
ncbi:hypothetical protein DES49_1850 [Halospina denitrificans]|uniref:Tail sheath protein C-terminal domain-containing protein n=1 Tax=Halospina denitrificans TaxID=332522 RepID=A0A4V3EQG2_9GAMM|nr:phage tail sheath C-terminal domain-containing protein [Halospina denitrificans]TDT41748.1 hypothetical protein DES49_1850 [Halospina denitrificans]